VCSPTVEKECDRFRGPLLMGEGSGDSTSFSLLLLGRRSGRRCDFGGVKEWENQVSRGLVLDALACVSASGPALRGGVLGGIANGDCEGVCCERWFPGRTTGL
jgi:hypothetical protein